MVRLECRGKPEAGELPAKARPPPPQLDSHSTVFEREVDLVAWSDSQPVPHGLGDHHLPVWPDPRSHAFEFNLRLELHLQFLDVVRLPQGFVGPFDHLR